MTGRERVLRTLEFDHPDRIPVDLWILPAAKMHHGEHLNQLLEKHETDIRSLSGPFDLSFYPEHYRIGNFVDGWGCRWTNIQEGMIGEVKDPIFAEYEKMDGYISPVGDFSVLWNSNLPDLKDQIHKARSSGKFIIGGWVSLFERMQFLRGTENLYCDIALSEEGMFEMAGIVMDFMHVYLSAWLREDIDAVAFGDDWGTQINLLISLEQWRSIFKPMYKELIDLIKAAGKKVFFHSDGHIFELYPELIDMGVNAVNSQVWCMDVDKIAQNFAGKITFWGEISRQNVLPNGTPDDVYRSAKIMKELLYVRGGGLIGQSEINYDVPLDNVRAVLTAW